jgi:hypothetical protein
LISKKWITSDLIKEKNEIISLSNTIRQTKNKALKKLKQNKKCYNKTMYSPKRHFIENKI